MRDSSVTVCFHVCWNRIEPFVMMLMSSPVFPNLTCGDEGSESWRWIALVDKKLRDERSVTSEASLKKVDVVR